MMDNNTYERIELFLTARNLKDQDVFSKSDPYIQVSFKRDFNRPYQILGRTQTINNELNPNFKKTFVIDYIFQSRQQIKFDVFDDDGNGLKDDYIGYVQTTVGALMGAKSQTAILDLKNPSKDNEASGKLIVRCEKIQQTNQYFRLKLAAEKILNVDSFFDFWDKSDPYIKFLKIRDDNTYIQVHRSETIMDNLNPSWKPFEIQIARLINPKKDSFKLQIWDWQQNGKDQFICEAFVNPQQLAPGNNIQLTSPKKGNAGTLVIQQFAITKKSTFVDYIRGGLQLNTIVAIDFTGSNGDPKFNTSLHYMNPHAPNQYQLAITAITQILLNYDYDKRIPAYGFGGKPNFIDFNSPSVSHSFRLSGNPIGLQATSVQHLLSLYQNALKNVSLSGPTKFSPLLYQTLKLSQICKQNGSNIYQILLILTDGQIHDMQETVNKIISGSNLPLSIIIVGVGNEQFLNMKTLDGDNGLVSTNGIKCPRDIVQFVPFRQMNLNGDMLARQLLAQVPNQVVQYMSMIGKPPGQFVPLNISNLVPKNIPKQ